MDIQDIYMMVQIHYKLSEIVAGLGKQKTQIRFDTELIEVKGCEDF